MDSFWMLWNKAIDGIADVVARKFQPFVKIATQMIHKQGGRPFDERQLDKTACIWRAEWAVKGKSRAALSGRIDTKLIPGLVMRAASERGIHELGLRNCATHVSTQRIGHCFDEAIEDTLRELLKDMCTTADATTTRETRESIHGRLDDALRQSLETLLETAITSARVRQDEASILTRIRAAKRERRRAAEQPPRSSSRASSIRGALGQRTGGAGGGAETKRPVVVVIPQQQQAQEHAFHPVIPSTTPQSPQPMRQAVGEVFPVPLANAIPVSPPATAAATSSSSSSSISSTAVGEKETDNVRPHSAVVGKTPVPALAQRSASSFSSKAPTVAKSATPAAATIPSTLAVVAVPDMGGVLAAASTHDQEGRRADSGGSEDGGSDDDDDNDSDEGDGGENDGDEGDEEGSGGEDEESDDNDEDDNDEDDDDDGDGQGSSAGVNKAPKAVNAKKEEQEQTSAIPIAIAQKHVPLAPTRLFGPPFENDPRLKWVPRNPSLGAIGPPRRHRFDYGNGKNDGRGSPASVLTALF